MNIVHLTVLGIAVATAVGAVLGDRIGMLQGRWSVLLRGAGLLMLGVILFGILQPLWQGEPGIPVLVFLLVLICLLEMISDRLERYGIKGSTQRIRSVLLVCIIAAHHFPEGMAAGYSAVQEGAAAAAVCGAVVLHSIPEAMVIVPTMRSADFSPFWGYLAAAISGAMEIAGVLVGAGI